MRRIFLLLACAIALPLASGSAQILTMRGFPPPPDVSGGPVFLARIHGPGQPGQRPGMQDSSIRRQLEQIKIWQMTKEMNLPTDKAEKFFPLYNKYNSRMRSITFERKRAVSALDSAIGNHAAEQEIKGQISRILKLDEELASAHSRFINSLGSILSPIEVARYMVFEQRFDREIRERIRMMMMQRGMRGRGR